jgi:hypothetical protein
MLAEITLTPRRSNDRAVNGARVPGRGAGPADPDPPRRAPTTPSATPAQSQPASSRPGLPRRAPTSRASAASPRSQLYPTNCSPYTEPILGHPRRGKHGENLVHRHIQHICWLYNGHSFLAQLLYPKPFHFLRSSMDFMTHGLRMYAMQCGHAMWRVRLSHLIQGLRLPF